MKPPKFNLKNTSVYRYLFKRDTIVATILVFLVIGLFVKIDKELGVFDPKDITSKDFDYNDLAFNLLSKTKNLPVDTSICIVNIGNADRKAIAQIINKVSRAQAKVIGVDVLFGDSVSDGEDTALRSIFHRNKQVVMAYLLDSAANHIANYFDDTLCKKGFVNFTLQDQNVIREFNPYIIAADTDFSFSTAIIKAADPDRYTDLMARGNKTEAINYTRAENKFIVIDGASQQGDFNIVKNKIVLIGKVASGTDYEDKHYTPLNSKFAGKSMPDLSGVLIQANIIRMELDGNYIHRWRGWQNLLFAFVICWIHTAFFIAYFIEKHIWFHVASKIAQLISSFVFIYLGLFLFYSFNQQINMTQTIVAIILAVDILYFYEAGVTWLHHKTGYKTLFHHEYPN